MRILVTGKDGQLGRSIQSLVVGTEQDGNFVFVGRGELDLSSSNSIDHYFKVNDGFDAIINCAAYTAVDRAEDEWELADQINHLAVKQIAEIATKQKAKLVHISTDYVFDGESNKPYVETDQTNPVNVYGRTKLAGENAIQETMPRDAVIIRASWIYSEYGHNFVQTMLRLGQERSKLSVVSDQLGSPTYASDLAGAILTIVQSKLFKDTGRVTEIYHYSNEGRVSWYEFAEEIFKIARIDCKVSPIGTEQYPTPARRPKSVFMSKDRVANAFGVHLSFWSDSLKNCIAQMSEYRNTSLRLK